MNDCLRALVALGGLLWRRHAPGDRGRRLHGSRPRRARARRRGGAAARRELSALRRHGLLLGHGVPPRRRDSSSRAAASTGSCARARRCRPSRTNRATACSNTRGTVAAARTDDPDSARAQFFVNLADNTQLDGGREPGYTVFAHVKEGIESFDAISRLPTGAAGPFRGRRPDAARRDQVDRAPRRSGAGRVTRRRPRGRAQSGDRGGGCRRQRSRCAASDRALPRALRRRRCRDRLDGSAHGARGRRPAPRHVRARRAHGDDGSGAEPAHAAATELYREAATDTTMTSELLAVCAAPAVPALPDASTVERRARCSASQRQVREFVAAAEAYLACLSRRHRRRGPQRRERNAAVARAQPHGRGDGSRSPPGSTSRSASSKRAAEAAQR